MSPGATVGIIIACLAMIIIFIAALLFFVICRRRFMVAKPSQSRPALAEVRAMQESGCSLPVDIPVEALTREPPPRYTSIDCSSSRQSHDMSTTSLPPPPPYSTQVHLPLSI